MAKPRWSASALHCGIRRIYLRAPPGVRPYSRASAMFVIRHAAVPSGSSQGQRGPPRTSTRDGIGRPGRHVWVSLAPENANESTSRKRAKARSFSSLKTITRSETTAPPSCPNSATRSSKLRTRTKPCRYCREASASICCLRMSSFREGAEERSQIWRDSYGRRCPSFTPRATRATRSCTKAASTRT